jgi:hypothetical protein
MKPLTITLILSTFLLMQYGCQSSDRKAFDTSDGVGDVVNQLNKAFGKGAHYTDITISYIKGVGTIISASGTQNPNDNKLLRKQYANSAWDDVSEVTLEVSGGAQAGVFMFTLDQIDQLKVVPRIVQEAAAKVKKDKNMEVVTERVSIIFPSRVQGPDDPLTYSVNLKPEHGGTLFVVVFDRKGKYQKMIY